MAVNQDLFFVFIVIRLVSLVVFVCILYHRNEDHECKWSCHHTLAV